ncbi:MAG: hypothetical protein ACI9S9_003377 [Planctomycetota bacterium]|jgi:hypothetical protein
MTKRVALLSVACGIAWHVLVTQMMGGSILSAFSWRLLPAVAAGLAAGAFTIRSRERRGGRERVLDVIVTYYLAVAVYMLAGFPFVAIFELRDLHMGELVGGLVGGLFSSALIATVYGVALIPLCFATRQVIWRLRGAGAPELDDASDDASRRD